MKLKNQPKNERGAGRKPLVHINLDSHLKAALEERATELGVSKALYISFLVAKDLDVPGYDLPRSEQKSS